MARRDGSELVARALRDNPPALDDLKRARMERRVLDAAREPADRPAPQQGRSRGSRAMIVGFGVGVAVAAAIFLAIMQPWAGEQAPVAAFDSIEGGVTVRSGDLAAGDRVETGSGEIIRVRIEDSRIEVAPTTEVAFERIEHGRVHLRVARGAVDVEFHPRRRGEEHLTVETGSARVEVVGTRFRVEVEQGGATAVSVSEGTVRVVPVDGGRAELVHAGGSTTVPSRLAASDQPVLPVEVVEESPGQGPAEAALHEETAEVEAGEAEPGGVEPSGEPVADHPPAWGPRVERARMLLQRGETEAARAALTAILRDSPPPRVRADVHTLLAESWEREDRERAASLYEQAAASAPGREDAHNAIFALARLRERQGDQEAARAAYRRYLREAPQGANAGLARQRLCALGDAEACR